MNSANWLAGSDILRLLPLPPCGTTSECGCSFLKTGTSHYQLSEFRYCVFKISFDKVNNLPEIQESSSTKLAYSFLSVAGIPKWKKQLNCIGEIRFVRPVFGTSVHTV